VSPALHGGFTGRTAKIEPHVGRENAAEVSFERLQEIEQ